MDKIYIIFLSLNDREIIICIIIIEKIDIIYMIGFVNKIIILEKLEFFEI